MSGPQFQTVFIRIVARVLVHSALPVFFLSTAVR